MKVSYLWDHWSRTTSLVGQISLPFLFDFKCIVVIKHQLLTMKKHQYKKGCHTERHGTAMYLPHRWPHNYHRWPRQILRPTFLWCLSSSSSWVLSGSVFETLPKKTSKYNCKFFRGVFLAFVHLPLRTREHLCNQNHSRPSTNILGEPPP